MAAAVGVDLFQLAGERTESRRLQGAPGRAEKKPRPDWVRCLALAGRDVLYVSMNSGSVSRVRFEGAGQPEVWQTLWEDGGEKPNPVTCLAVGMVGEGGEVEDRIDRVVFGANCGNARLLDVAAGDWSTSVNGKTSSAVLHSAEWRAHEGR